MSKSPITDLIAEANSWRNEDPNADSTEQVSEEVTSLIARLTDALEFVTDNYVLKSWSGLFEILNEAYPEDVFLTLPNNESRDSGPRIISLIRLLDRERTRAEVAESRLEAATVATDDHEPIKILRDKTFVAWQDVLTVTSERAEDAIAFRVADTLAYYGCRASNPKADDPHMGYHAFSEDQREHLRGKQADATAEIVRIIASERAAAKAEASNQNARQAIECSNARFDLLNQSRKERAAVEPEWGLSDSTLDTFPEPHFTSREANVRRQQRKGHPAIKVVRRGVTPWLPVEPVQVDPQPQVSESGADE